MGLDPRLNLNPLGLCLDLPQLSLLERDQRVLLLGHPTQDLYKL